MTAQRPLFQCLVGQVRHARLRPVEHAFQYPGFFFRIDAGWLDNRLSAAALAVAGGKAAMHPEGDLPTPHPGGMPHAPSVPAEVLARVAGLPLLAVNRRGLFGMHACDHGTDPRTPLGTWLLGIVRDAGLEMPRRVTLLAYPRVLGYAFKPVSFWFLGRDDGAVTSIVAEVHNTFGERHAYLLRHPVGDRPPCSLESDEACEHSARSAPAPIRSGQTLEADKCFTVSPFCTLAGRYRFRFHHDEERALARIEYDDDQGTLLITSMSGQARPISPASLLRLAFGVPWQSLGVILRIHWQALRLFLRRVPFHGAKQVPASRATPPFTA